MDSFSEKSNLTIRKKSKGQIAIEFLLLTTFGVFFLFVMLIILGKISSDTADSQRIESLQDLGSSIANEISTASEMEPGYHRTLNLPNKIKGQEYNLTVEEGGSGNSYLIISSGEHEFLYQIPKASGNFSPGNNIITKQEQILVNPTY